VFESIEAVRRKVLGGEEVEELVGFFQTKCVISLSKEVPHGKFVIPPGRYTVNSIQEDRRCSLSSANGDKFVAIPLKKLIPAGFERIEFHA